MNGKLEIGDVLFIKGKGLISKLIALFAGEYTHCAIVIDNIGSVSIIEAQRFTKSRIVPLNYIDYDIIRMNLSDDQKIKLKTYAIRFSGYGYDYLKIVGYFCRILFRLKKNNYFNMKYQFLCSELSEILLCLIGKIDMDIKFGDRTPNELYSYLNKIG